MELIQDRSNRQYTGEVFYANSEKDLVSWLKKFNKQKTPVTILGGRTALTGSCVPKSGIAIDVSKLKTESLDRPQSQNQKIYPASISIEDLDNDLTKKQLVYLPTPGYKKCTLGGNVATNASGPRTFSFGPTRKHVWFLRVVLMNGDILEIQRGMYISSGHDFKVKSLSGTTYTIPKPSYDWVNIKNATGLYNQDDLDLIDLFVGSEGILGVITQVGIKVQSFLHSIKTEAYFFTSEAEALKCAQKFQQYGFDAQTKQGFISVEFMDQGALRLCNSEAYYQYEAAIEIEYFEGDSKTQAFIETELRSFSVEAQLSGSEVAKFRYSIPFNLSELLRKYQTIKIASDFAVPSDQFPKIWQAYKDAMKRFDALTESNDITTAIWGHIGNSHLHLNFIPQSKAQESLGQELYLELAEKCVALGGVLSAEHGVGKKKFNDGRSILEVQNPAMIPEVQKIKKSLDPDLLLNRGNMVTVPV